LRPNEIESLLASSPPAHYTALPIIRSMICDLSRIGNRDDDLHPLPQQTSQFKRSRDSARRKNEAVSIARIS
jgi:hypothetical protein